MKDVSLFISARERVYQAPEMLRVTALFEYLEHLATGIVNVNGGPFLFMQLLVTKKLKMMHVTVKHTNIWEYPSITQILMLS